ncbi:hypothetical protein HHUSO_G33396 [Huso huso]|uniref:Uncharacterized protein n=1 Tax=Huso huso TaxID=61971 RepID=A0ABR0Y817_HUSHU
MLLKVYWPPCLLSISKSKDRVVVVPRAKFTQDTSSKRRCRGGLCTKMKPLSRGYRSPELALYEQVMHCAPEWLWKLP